jgi:peptidoglycan/LPS O-acetylase OafA/YrhL
MGPASMFDPAMSDQDQRRFNPRIESMRGIAALTVAAMHVTSSLVEDIPTRGSLDLLGLPLIKALSNGYGAVVAFFVISGFVLARSLDRNFSARRFFRGRVFRLFPAAITTIGLFAGLFWVWGFVVYRGASYAPLNILANMAMLRADIDAVMWSMKAELAATPLIFVCVWLHRRSGPRPVIATAIVLFGLAFVGQYSKLIGDDTNLAPLFAFPVGILVLFKGEAIARRLRPGAALLATLGSVAVFCACSFFKPSGTWVLLVQCLSAATLVMLIAYRSEVPLLAVLDTRIVRFYGRISYSFYLLHPLTFWATGQFTAWLLNGVDGLPGERGRRHLCSVFGRGGDPARLCVLAFCGIAGDDRRASPKAITVDGPLLVSGKI